MSPGPDLDPNTSLKKEIERLGRDSLAVAQRSLRAEAGALHDGIHDARKRFKRLRGLLRLVRAADRKRARAENDRLRTMARTLSVARDAAARVETLDRLLARFPEPREQVPLARIRDRLAERRDRITGAETDLSQKIETVIAGCEASAAAFSALDIPRGRRQAARLLAHGFARNYARARAALAAATENGGEEPWHTLRKRTRDQWSHSIFLSGAWPSAFYARVTALKSLIDLLGDDRDLIVLAHMIADEPDEVGEASDLAVLGPCLKTRSAELHAAIRKTAAGLLQEEPDAVERRIRHLWLLAADGK